MSDTNGAVDTTPAEGVSLPNPVNTEPEPADAEAARQTAEKTAAEKEADGEGDKPKPVKTEPEPKKVPTAREALTAAAKKVEASEKAAAEKTPAVKTDAKAESKAAKVEPAKDAGPVRDEAGKFVTTKPAMATAAGDSKYPDAPARFSTDAKAAWAQAPENVRSEVHRAVGELERGFEKHRADAAAYAEVKEFDELARKSGTTLKAAMANYVGIEQLLRKDPVRGVERILANQNISLRDFAAHIMGQKPDQVASRQDGVIRELNAKIAGLEKQIGGVTQTIQQQRSDGVMGQITAFAAQPGHERFEELAKDIEFFIKSGRTTDLAEAYTLAERLNPASADGTPQRQLSAAVDLTAQTVKGGKSINGAPGLASDPSNRRIPSPSSRKALERAFARAG